MWIRVPVDEKPIRLREYIRIPVRRRDDPAQAIAHANRAFAHGDVAGSDALRRLHRRVEAQALLRRAAREPFRIRAQLLPLVRIPDEREDPVSDEIDRRLVAGEEQEGAVDEQLIPIHNAKTLAHDQHRDEVRPRLPYAHLRQRCRIVENAADSFDERGEAVRFSAVDVEELVGELAKLRAVARRNVH